MKQSVFSELSHVNLGGACTRYIDLVTCFLCYLYYIISAIAFEFQSHENIDGVFYVV